MQMSQTHRTSNCPRGRRPLTRILYALLALALVLAAIPHPATAAGEGSLTLQMQYVSGGKTTPVGGATATAYLVADLDDAVNHYTLRDEFASLDVNFDEGLDAQTMDALAQRAADVVSAQKVQGVATATADAQGKLAFGSLPNGIYLVLQTAAKGDAEKYTSLTPFLISVPQVTEEGVVYDVVAYPKFAPIPPKKMPQTNDPFDSKTAVACLVAGGVLVAAGVLGRKRFSKDESEVDGQ